MTTRSIAQYCMYNPFKRPPTQSSVHNSQHELVGHSTCGLSCVVSTKFSLLSDTGGWVGGGGLKEGRWGGVWKRLLKEEAKVPRHPHPARNAVRCQQARKGLQQSLTLLELNESCTRDWTQSQEKCGWCLAVFQTIKQLIIGTDDVESNSNRIRLFTQGMKSLRNINAGGCI